jgi:hypothetical protein
VVGDWKKQRHYGMKNTRQHKVGGMWDDLCTQRQAERERRSLGCKAPQPSQDSLRSGRRPAAAARLRLAPLLAAGFRLTGGLVGEAAPLRFCNGVFGQLS